MVRVRVRGHRVGVYRIVWVGYRGGGGGSGKGWGGGLGHGAGLKVLGIDDFGVMKWGSGGGVLESRVGGEGGLGGLGVWGIGTLVGV